MNFENKYFFSLPGNKETMLTIHYSSSSSSEEIVPRLPRRDDVKIGFWLCVVCSESLSYLATTSLPTYYTVYIQQSMYIATADLPTKPNFG